MASSYQMDSLPCGSFARTCAYLDPETISQHISPWQQIVAFFVHTQQPTEVSDHNRATPTDAPTSTPFHFQFIKTVCLNFCMELLNQRIGTDEYECALVCALALLGHSRIGWYTLDSFPPILLKIIKLARFMVLS
ncbi:unnamed protein product [Penicillium salamii]|nr:unnamed protein product [Penicillium salamii]